jgi:hypothetical protein
VKSRTSRVREVAQHRSDYSSHTEETFNNRVGMADRMADVLERTSAQVARSETDAVRRELNAEAAVYEARLTELSRENCELMERNQAYRDQIDSLHIAAEAGDRGVLDFVKKTLANAHVLLDPSARMFNRVIEVTGLTRCGRCREVTGGARRQGWLGTARQAATFALADIHAFTPQLSNSDR